MLRKVILIAVLVALLLALVPSIASAAQPPPPVVPNEYWMVITTLVRVYANKSFTVVEANLYSNVRMRSYVQVLLGGPSGPVLVDYHIISQNDSTIITSGSGWLPRAAFGSSLTYLGTAMPVALTAADGQRAIGHVSECRKWLECNGYSRAGTGRVWGWL